MRGFSVALLCLAILPFPSGVAGEGDPGEIPQEPPAPEEELPPPPPPPPDPIEVARERTREIEVRAHLDLADEAARRRLWLYAVLHLRTARRHGAAGEEVDALAHRLENASGIGRADVERFLGPERERFVAARQRAYARLADALVGIAPEGEAGAETLVRALRYAPGHREARRRLGYSFVLHLGWIRPEEREREEGRVAQGRRLTAAHMTGAFRSVASDRYRIYTDIDPASRDEAVLRETIGTLESMREDYALLFGIDPDAFDRRRVALFRDRAGYVAYARSRRQDEIAAQTYCVFDPRSSWILLCLDSRRGTSTRHKLRFAAAHEGHHQFFRRHAVTLLPRWVDEGLGEFFEHLTIDGGRTSEMKFDRGHLERGLAEGALSLDVLDGWRGSGTDEDLNDRNVLLAYAGGWSLCTYALLDPGRAPAFLDYLHATTEAAREAGVPRIRRYPEDPPPAFEADWLRFVREGLIPVLPTE